MATRLTFGQVEGMAERAEQLGKAQLRGDGVFIGRIRIGGLGRGPLKTPVKGGRRRPVTS